MGREIERKFLVTGTEYRESAEAKQYRQGYLSRNRERTVRVRTAGDKGFITVKGKNAGIVRTEFEYEIPLSDADAMLSFLCEKPLIEKRRYHYEYEGHVWEIDEFSGDNEGLVIAEIELTSEDDAFVKPDWIGDEVSGDPRYFNSNLVNNPYRSWE